MKDLKEQITLKVDGNKEPRHVRADYIEVLQADLIAELLLYDKIFIRSTILFRVMKGYLILKMYISQQHPNSYMILFTAGRCFISDENMYHTHRRLFITRKKYREHVSKNSALLINSNNETQQIHTGKAYAKRIAKVLKRQEFFGEVSERVHSYLNTYEKVLHNYVFSNKKKFCLLQNIPDGKVNQFLS